jgi:subtilisin-like proprotein convertase family protein
MMVPDIVGCDKGMAPSGRSSFPFDLGTMSGLNQNCAYFSKIQGTSFAAPVVSGVIALMKEANPRLNWRAVKNILAYTARNIDPSPSTSHPLGLNLAGHVYQPGWVENDAGYSFHPWYGFGLVDAKAAVDMAKTFDTDTVTEGKWALDPDGDFVYSRTHTAPGLSIPDNSATGAESTISVANHNLSIEHVLVKVNVTHGFPTNLGLELTSPAGTKTMLMNINSGLSGTNLSNVLFGANAFYGERTSGAWTLRLVDGLGGGAGYLLDWSIAFFGNRGDELPDQTPPLIVTDHAFDVGTSTFSWTHSTSGDRARYEICVVDLATFEAEDQDISKVCMDGDWRTVLTNSFVITGHMEQGRYKELQPGNAYAALLRTVDTSENESEEWAVDFWEQPE